MKDAAVQKLLGDVQEHMERFERLVEEGDREASLMVLDEARRAAQMLSQTLDSVRRTHEKPAP